MNLTNYLICVSSVQTCLAIHLKKTMHVKYLYHKWVDIYDLFILDYLRIIVFNIPVVVDIYRDI